MDPLHWNLVLLTVGLFLLVAGGDLLVRGAVAVAQRFGVSELMIGLTLVGLGTSTPELLTSLQAAAAGSPGIAVGNVVGSNISNILLILGIAALVSPLRVEPRALRRDGAMVLLATLACIAAVLVGSLERWTGAGLVGLLAAYLVYVYRRERRSEDPSARMHAHEATAVAAAPAPVRPWAVALFVIGGLVLLLVGARLLVGGAIQLAAAMGVPETVVGLTVVAVGTSLPELTTSVVAALRGQGDIAFGNVLGSNIFNLLGILGVTALVTPIPVPPEVARLDVWVMLAATLMLLAAGMTGGRLTRGEGFLFVAAYAGYTAWLYMA